MEPDSGIIRPLLLAQAIYEIIPDAFIAALVLQQLEGFIGLQLVLELRDLPNDVLKVVAAFLEIKFPYQLLQQVVFYFLLTSPFSCASCSFIRERLSTMRVRMTGSRSLIVKCAKLLWRRIRAFN